MNGGPDKRRPGRPKTVDRQHAIEVAVDTYWREGLHAVSLNELCRRAGLSKPALYREFGSEDGLMEAALEHYRQLIVVPLLAFLATEQPFATVLEMIIAGMTTSGSVPVGCLFTKMRLARPRLGAKTLARIQTVEQERLTAFEAWIRRGLASAEVDPNLSPAFAARYLDTQLSTLLVQMGAEEPPEEVRAQAQLALGVLVRDADRPIG